MLLAELEREEDRDIMRLTHAQACALIPNRVDDKPWKHASKMLDRYRKMVFSWDGPDQDVDSLAKLRAAYIRHLGGEPNDPAVKEKIRKTVEALKRGPVSKTAPKKRKRTRSAPLGQADKRG